MISQHTRLLIRDELLGFAKSKVMIVLWIVLPILATVGYFVLPKSFGQQQQAIPLTAFMGVLLSSLAGTVAAIMLSVDIVTERSRKVYELFIIRPIRPESILWAKFFAVFFCIAVACCASICLGIAVDLMRGTELSDTMIQDVLETIGTIASVMAVSAAVGVFFGVISSSILVAVILIMYLGQNLVIVPLLPAVLRWDPALHWIGHVFSFAATIGVMYFAGVLFRRKEY